MSLQVCATPTAGGAGICAITDSNGRYRLEVLAGSYNVSLTSGPVGFVATTATTRLVTVTAGQQYLERRLRL